MDQAPTHQPETQQTEHAGRRNPLGLYWAGLLLPVLYVLSVGPAAKLGEVGVVSEPVLGTVYYPVVLAMQRSIPFRNFLAWYLFDVWRCKSG